MAFEYIGRSESLASYGNWIVHTLIFKTSVKSEIYLTTLDILFSSNHNIHKSSSGHCFWASDPLVDKFYKNHSIKAQKQRLCELLWMLWFDEKSIFITTSFWKQVGDLGWPSISWLLRYHHFSAVRKIASTHEGQPITTQPAASCFDCDDLPAIQKQV